MLKLDRFKRIKDHRLFGDFTWPTELLPFSTFNLIYGWNGTGKTTLSNLLRSLQTKTNLSEGEASFEVKGNIVLGNAIATAALPQVRVFNRDYIERSILADRNQFSSVYYFGEDSIAKQAQIETLKAELISDQGRLSVAQSKADAARADLDKFCITRAKLIKELLLSSKVTTYNNYAKDNYKAAIARMTNELATKAVLTDDQKNKFRKLKDSSAKGKLALASSVSPDLVVLRAEITELLGRNVVSKVITALSKDRAVAEWVHQGLALHTGEHVGETCKFCNQKLPTDRLKELEAHFNDAFNLYKADLASAQIEIQALHKNLTETKFVDKALLYDHLQDGYMAAVKAFETLVASAELMVAGLEQAIQKKLENPLEPVAVGAQLAAMDVAVGDDFERATQSINGSIASHNSTTDDFEAKQTEAFTVLEQSYLAESFADYKGSESDMATFDAEKATIAAKVTNTQVQITSLETDILENRKPADEINAELRSYLGHSDLQFQVHGTGYAVVRRGGPALNLSEGEKVAITFLHFLKTLQDKDVDLANTLVVIDDPVSSLDANSLFSAFGYMKARVENVGQLILLTHNFQFFRQARNWFHHLKKQKSPDLAVRPARFYMMSTSLQAGIRMARIGQLDPLLEEHESEYHYLFKRIVEESERPDPVGPLEHYYSMPNLGRRFIEGFFAFRYPDLASLQQKFDQAAYDTGKKTRILRFLHTYSHADHVAEPGHDPSILSETRAIFVDLLDLVKTCDAEHFDRMKKAIQP